jgi:hypothetical protein
MDMPLDPLVSEFATQEDADQYELWFQAKVRASLCRADDPTVQRHTSDEVVRRMDTLIHATAAQHAQRRLA